SDATVRQAAINLAVQMLGDSDPRRREDASYVLGRLRSDASIDQHVALLQWDPADPKKAEWPTVAQAAESVGLVGAARAVPLLMALVKPAPAAFSTVQRSQREAMTTASSNAMVALGRLRYRPALEEAARLLQMDPQGECPAPLRAASAFAVGLLSAPGKPPEGVNLFGI